jgi:hypothetical protein
MSIRTITTERAHERTAANAAKLEAAACCEAYILEGGLDAGRRIRARGCVILRRMPWNRRAG